MSGKGFIESLLDDMALWAAVQDSKDSNGKPDPYKAAGIAYGLNGSLTNSDIARLGTYLGVEGAFDNYPKTTNYPETTNTIPESHSMDWGALSEAEKQRRISKAQHTKAQYRYWSALWEYKELITHVQPVELATIVWEEVSKKNEGDDADPELSKKFANWLRKNHGIRMDSDGKMHIIASKNGAEE